MRAILEDDVTCVDLAEHILEVARSVHADELARLSRLDTKLNAMLAAAGLAIPLVANVMPHAQGAYVRAGLILVVVLLLVSALLAVCALQMARRGMRAMAGDAFDSEEIDEAQRKESTASYVMYLARGYWGVAESVRDVNDRRGNVLFDCQSAFGMAILVMLPTMVAAAFGWKP